MHTMTPISYMMCGPGPLSTYIRLESASARAVSAKRLLLTDSNPPTPCSQGQTSGKTLTKVNESIEGGSVVGK